MTTSYFSEKSPQDLQIYAPDQTTHESDHFSCKNVVISCRGHVCFYAKSELCNKSFAVLKIMRMRQSTVSTLQKTNSPMIVLNQRLGFASPSLLMVQDLLPWLHAQLISRNFLYHIQPYVQGESKHLDCVGKWLSYYLA